MDEHYLEILKNTSHPQADRLDAIGQLTNLTGRNAISILESLLKDEDKIVRVVAIQQLGQWLDVTADSLIEMLNDKELIVVDNAIRVLQQGDAKVRNKLLLELRSENPWIRTQIARVLGAFRTKEVVDALISLLNDSNEQTREFAALSLGKSEDVEAVPHLLNSLNDSAEYVRFRVIEALGNLKDSRAFLPLVAQIDKETKKIYKREIVKALGNLGVQDAIPLLEKIGLDSDEMPVLREDALKALLKMGTEGKRVLERVKINGDVFARITARKVIFYDT